MLYIHAVRVSHTFEKAKAMVSRWSLECDKMVVYRHKEGTPKEHLHLLMEGCRIGKKQLRNIGAEFIDLKGTEKCKFEDQTTQDLSKYISYMTKGKYDPMFFTGYEVSYLAECKSKGYDKEDTQVAKKKCRYLEFFNEYDEDCEYNMRKHLINDRHPDQGPVPIADKYQFVKTYIRKQIMDNGVWTPNNGLLFKSFVMTYCYRHSIPIPDNEKGWKL